VLPDGRCGGQRLRPPAERVIVGQTEMNAATQYSAFLSTLPPRQRYESADLLVSELFIAQEGALRMFYAPFDWINPSARIVILGITPGWTQMEIGCRTARTALAEGKNLELAGRLAKQQASFAGSMRSNLVRMLDALGLPALLQIGSSGDLFGHASSLLHTSSAIRYPTFVQSANYTGSNPPAAKSPFLLRVARELLVPELEAVPEAAIVPLGRAVEDVLEALAAEGCFRGKRWLTGFPHPSGANGHRARIFEENRESLARQLRHLVLPKGAT